MSHSLTTMTLGANGGDGADRRRVEALLRGRAGLWPADVRVGASPEAEAAGTRSRRN